MVAAETHVVKVKFCNRVLGSGGNEIHVRTSGSTETFTYLMFEDWKKRSVQGQDVDANQTATSSHRSDWLRRTAGFFLLLLIFGVVELKLRLLRIIF